MESYFSIGAVVIFFAKILDLILAFADNAIQLAVVRYSNFTGKIALQSFKEDQELWNIINTVNENLLPIAEVLMPVLFFLAFYNAFRRLYYCFSDILVILYNS